MLTVEQEPAYDGDDEQDGGNPPAGLHARSAFCQAHRDAFGAEHNIARGQASADLKRDGSAERSAADVYAERDVGRFTREPRADDLGAVGVKGGCGNAHDQRSQEAHDEARARQGAPNNADERDDVADDHDLRHADAVGQGAQENAEDDAGEVRYRHDHAEQRAVDAVAHHDGQGCTARHDERELQRDQAQEQRCQDRPSSWIEFLLHLQPPPYIRMQLRGYAGPIRASRDNLVLKPDLCTPHR